MEITKLEELKEVIDLISKNKASYYQYITEGFISIRYNPKKKYIEEHAYQGNPYSGKVSQRYTEWTVEQIFDHYKNFPEFWVNFKVDKPL